MAACAVQAVRAAEMQGGTTGLSALTAATSAATASSFPPSLRASLTYSGGVTQYAIGSTIGATSLTAATAAGSQFGGVGGAVSLADRFSASQYHLSEDEHAASDTGAASDTLHSTG
jgi:hypothetical protein